MSSVNRTTEDHVQFFPDTEMNLVGNSVYLISVEGNIGSGKSTFLERLRETYDSQDRKSVV